MTKVSIIAVQRLSLRDAEDFIVDRMKSSNAPLYMDDHRAMVHESLVHDLEDREGPLHLSAYESSVLSSEVNEYLLADKTALEIAQAHISEERLQSMDSALFSFAKPCIPVTLALEPEDAQTHLPDIEFPSDKLIVFAPSQD